MTYIYLRYRTTTYHYYIGVTDDIKRRNHEFYNLKKSYGGGKILDDLRKEDWDKETNTIKKGSWIDYILYCGRGDRKVYENKCIQLLYDIFERNERTGILLNPSGYLHKLPSILPIDWNEFINEKEENKIILAKNPKTIVSILQKHIIN